MRLILLTLFLCLLSPNTTAQTLDVYSISGNDFSVQVCTNDGVCVDYDNNETITLNTSIDYIVKITPKGIDNSNDLSSYIANGNFILNFILFMVFLTFIVILLKVMSNVQ